MGGGRYKVSFEVAVAKARTEEEGKTFDRPFFSAVAKAVAAVVAIRLIVQRVWGVGEDGKMDNRKEEKEKKSPKEISWNDYIIIKVIRSFKPTKYQMFSKFCGDPEESNSWKCNF